MGDAVTPDNLEQTEKRSCIAPDDQGLPVAAVRALAEAAQRRKLRADALTQTMRQPKELGGPRGNEPTRYGDWERGGRAVDF